MRRGVNARLRCRCGALKRGRCAYCDDCADYVERPHTPPRERVRPLRRSEWAERLAAGDDVLCARRCMRLSAVVLDDEPLCVECADAALERLAAIELRPELRELLPSLDYREERAGYWRPTGRGPGGRLSEVELEEGREKMAALGASLERWYAEHPEDELRLPADVLERRRRAKAKDVRRQEREQAPAPDDDQTRLFR